jgi:DNA-binding Xre family transcriptional regulator
MVAAEKAEAFRQRKAWTVTNFAVQSQTTDKTLRKFLKTGKVRLAIFNAIAGAMETTPEDLLKPPSA